MYGPDKMTTVDIADLINTLSNDIKELTQKFNDMHRELGNTLTDHSARLRFVEAAIIETEKTVRVVKHDAADNLTAAKMLTERVVKIETALDAPKKTRSEYKKAIITALIGLTVGFVFTELLNTYIHLPKSERLAIERSVEARR